MNDTHIDPRTPILVGCGQLTGTSGEPSSARSNVAFSAEAARAALADTSASIGAEALGRKIDAIAVLEFFPDISPRFASPFGRSSNPPKSVANRLDATPRQLIYTHQGGNTPQYMVNRFAEEIAGGGARRADDLPELLRRSGPRQLVDDGFQRRLDRHRLRDGGRPGERDGQHPENTPGQCHRFPRIAPARRAARYHQ